MLRDIYQNVVEVVGSSDRVNVLRLINRAAKEIYDSEDLPGCLDEDTFTFDSSNNLITLPWYATQIRAIRWSEINRRVTLTDQRRAFAPVPWTQPYLNYVLQEETPLEQNLTEDGRLTVTLADEETELVTVTITGQTTTAAYYRETLSFEPGETEKETTAQFTQKRPHGVKAISKSRVTVYDVTITQSADGRIVATIPNILERASNALVRIRSDNGAAINDAETVDVLYKQPYLQLSEDTDEFLESDKFDDAIAWRVKENYYSTDETKIELVALANAKCNAMLRRIASNIEAPTEKIIPQGSNPARRAALKYRMFNRYGRTR